MITECWTPQSSHKDTFFSINLVLVNDTIAKVLTLRAVSLFFKILPISNVGDSIAYIIGHRSLSLPKTWFLFRHEVLLSPTCLPGLESPQALRRMKSNAVFSFF